MFDADSGVIICVLSDLAIISLTERELVACSLLFLCICPCRMERFFFVFFLFWYSSNRGSERW